MNVSKSIDWEHTHIARLDSHRFIGQLKSVAVLDSHLLRAGDNTMYDRDRLIVVLYRKPDGLMRLNKQDFKSINVLEETR